VNETPHQKRDHYVAQTIRAKRAAGLEPDVLAIEAGVGAVLAETDRATRAGELQHTKSEPSDDDKAKAKDQRKATALAEKAGGNFYTRDLTAADDKKKTLPKITGTEAARHVAMIRRVKILTAKDPNKRLQAGRDGWLDHDYEYPAFAQAIALETWAAQNGHASPEFKRGGLIHRYAELSTVDRVRMYYAALELICNRSNGAVGFGWWVTK
jgi:hypothetical protein